MYRACALYASLHGIAVDDIAAIEKMLADVDITIEPTEDGNRILLNGLDVTDRIRSAEISGMASAISALPPVRHKMVQLQRDIAGRGGFVLDGRDIGTYVFPNAQVKFFLVADAKERARRRLLELSARGVSTDQNTVLSDLLERDKNDQGRALAPLVAAPDAIPIDTTNLSIEDQVDLLFSHVSGMLAKA